MLAGISCRDGAGTMVPPGSAPGVRGGRLTIRMACGSDAGSLEAPIVQVTDGESAAAGAATSERDVLLATKLNVPGLQPDLVPRPRLAQRLDEGRGRGLVLACAPAGYGKTVLLAEWVRSRRHPVAWLSLDAGDNDPARFWRHTVAALDRVRPGISEPMGPLLGPPPPPSFEPLVTALINELTGQHDVDEALLLVLDDYHVISSQLVHESLGFLLEHRPPELHLALAAAATRHWPWRGCGPAGS